MKVDKIIFLLIGVGIASIGHAREPKWEISAESSSHVEFFDPETILCLSDGTVKLWSKSIYTKKGVKEAVKEMGVKYKNINYSLSQIVLDCKNNKLAINDTIYYSKSGDVVDTPEHDFRWIYVPPGTVASNLIDKVCGVCSSNYVDDK